MGKFKKGERHINSKLTEGNVVLIKVLLAGGRSRKDIARMFRISYFTVADIDLGRTWGHIEAPKRGDK